MTTAIAAVESGQLVPMDGSPHQPLSAQQDQFAGIGTAPFSPEAQAVLLAPLADDEIAVLPDSGELYMPGEAVRQRLHRAFGVGGWAWKPVSTIVDQDNTNKAGESEPRVFHTGHLIVLGRFVAEATGDGRWIKSNPKTDYGTALESAKTNAISRACKDLGMWSELRNKEFTTPWKLKNSVNQGGVWRKRPPQPIKPPANVSTRAAGVGAMPHNTEHVDKDRELREGYAAVMGSAVPPPDPEDNVKYRKGDRKATAKDLERVLDKTMPEVELNRDIGGEMIEVTSRETGEKSMEPKRTTEQNARIHALRAELGYDKGSGEKDYRGVLWRDYRVKSSAILTAAQADELILRLEKSKNNLNRR